ncbi:MAG: hypothetical protein Fur0010_01740 [Bdellovibrio sp.]
MNGNTNMNSYLEAQNPGKKDASFSFWRLVFLGLMSAALSSLQPFWLFVPVPLTLALLIYGRGKGTLLGVVGTAVLLMLSINTKVYPLAAVAVFAGAFIEALLIGEIFYRKMNPIRGLLMTGFIMLAIVTVGIGMAHYFGKVSLTEVLTQFVTTMLEHIKNSNAEFLNAGGEEARLWRDYISQPDLLVRKIIEIAPMALFGSIYFGLWLCLFIVLRNSLVWKQKLNYPFLLRDLIEFKVPFQIVWALIFGLALYLVGDQFLGEKALVWGQTIIYCVGVFYFFQGFGVFSDFLSFLRIYGFIRVMMMFLTIFTAWRFIAIVGLFDVWFNFRRFFKKKNDEGDML